MERKYTRQVHLCTIPENANSVVPESRLVGPGEVEVGRAQEDLQKGTGMMDTVLNLDRGGGFTGTYICQPLSICTL